MPSKACLLHKEEYRQSQVLEKTWNQLSCCKKFCLYQKRSLDLFKQEYIRDKQICLTSKSYLCTGEVIKQVSKGVSIRQNPLTFENYHSVLTSGVPHQITNRGFRSKSHRVFTYAQKKKGLNSVYVKRKVLADGIHTIPLDL